MTELYDISQAMASIHWGGAEKRFKAIVKRLGAPYGRGYRGKWLFTAEDIEELK